MKFVVRAPASLANPGAARVAVGRSICAGASLSCWSWAANTNIALDLWHEVMGLHMNVRGAAGDGHRRICHVTDRPHDGT